MNNGIWFDSQSIAHSGEAYGNFGPNGSIPWLQNTDGTICFICKEDIEYVTHFFLDFTYSRNNFEFPWNKLKFKITGPTKQMGLYLQFSHRKYRWTQQGSFAVKGLALPFDNEINILFNRSVSVAVGKIHKLCKAMLRELEAPWLVNQ